ncbi:T9SS type A sorting domain-containing protein [Bacteroidota bacterium]
MIKRLILSITLLSLYSSSFSQTKSFFDFKVKNIAGDSVDLKVFKGHKIMVVNTASLCGYTYQYEELEQLYQQYKALGFVIIGFPSNDFGNQEPGTDSEILDFCQSTYDVTFPMMSKIHVTGASIHPLYKWLTLKSENGVKDAPVLWNFQKFLINEDGTLYDVRSSATTPLASVITSWIAQGASVDEKQSLLSNLSIYPMPAKDQFNVIITMESLAYVKVNLMTVAGQMVEELWDGDVDGELRVTYNTDKLKSGNYIVVAEINGEQQTTQIRIGK